MNHHHSDEGGKAVPLTTEFTVLAIIFAAAIFVGLFKVNEPKDVLRDGKILFLYLSYFPLRSILKKRDILHLFYSLMLFVFIGTSAIILFKVVGITAPGGGQ